MNQSHSFGGRLKLKLYDETRSGKSFRSFHNSLTEEKEDKVGDDGDRDFIQRDSKRPGASIKDGGEKQQKTKSLKFKMSKGLGTLASSFFGVVGGGGGTSTDSGTNESSKNEDEKISRAEKNKLKETPMYGSRVKTGDMGMKAKAEVLKQYPELEIQRAETGDRGSQAVLSGPNSIRAELMDLNGMLKVMSDNVTTLTHSSVERFFDWFPIFLTYLERYMVVEEEFIFRPIEEKVDGLRGDLKPSKRMLMRGKIQRALNDLIDLQDIFKPYLPAGQKLPQVMEACEIFTKAALEYWTLVTDELPKLVHEKFTNTKESEKLRTRLVKHVVNHVGYKDFLAIYTRWMGASELLEWKTNVLFPCDYKFFSYSQWDRDIENEHYFIAANFGEILQEENEEDASLVEESKADFERAQAQRAQMEQEMRGDEYDDDFDASTEGSKTPRSFLARSLNGLRTPRTPRSNLMRNLNPRTPRSNQMRHVDNADSSRSKEVPQSSPIKSEGGGDGSN